MFLLAGVLSLVLIYIFLYTVKRANPEKYRKSRFITHIAVFTIFAGMNILYFTNIIPPIPLSLKASGIYHDLYRDEGGNYIGTFEDQGWKGIFKLYDPVHLSSGDPVYAYSAVFSPSSLNTTIVHEWQYYDGSTNKWVTKGTVTLPIIGGREEGYRTFSMRTNLEVGRWRVNVNTLEGQVIGRMHFTVIPSDEGVTLSAEVNGK